VFQLFGNNQYASCLCPYISNDENILVILIVIIINIIMFIFLYCRLIIMSEAVALQFNK